jgi:hypothetical protein
MSSENHLPALPAPFSSTEFLNRMKGDTPGLYLLGSLNRHITVHSQQCRAINLIQALIECHGLEGKELAIVGAGFAGLTAAAFALDRTTAHVTLFDVSPRPLWMQDRCENRWLHPGIYDWPYPGALEPCSSLPVLNWRAAAAADVAAQIRAEWEHIAASKNLLRLRLETEVKAVSADLKGGLALKLANGQQENFDVVVLAVGFGIERGGPGRVAYWNDADGLDGIAEGSSVLVSGFGDGGLADVLRLCLPDIRQDSLIELVRHVPIETRSQLIEAEKNFGGQSGGLDEFYNQLRVEPIIQLLADSTLPVMRVTLAGIGHLYDPRSAILNRFLISQLRQVRGEDAFELINKPVDVSSLAELPDGRCRIKIGDSPDEREFDHVVLRLGPEPVYKRISASSDLKVWEERRTSWLDMPQSLDRTRTLLEPVTAAAQNLLQRQDFLAYESSSRRWCLVLAPPNASIEWAVHVRHALENEAQYLTNLNVAPLELCSEGALASETAIRGTVRALCAADIVVADVSNYDPLLFLLLGIRATVRRSVTIACTEKQLNQDLWENIPFNLKELNLVSFSNEDEGQKELRAALHAGLAQSVSSHYLDLPVYDYVREESSDEATADHRRVLLLRAFGSYTGGRKIHVQNRIRKALGYSDDAPVESVIDQVSPRLAGQRLYEAIRHWKLCVVDLTWWRPNVMFELGVRLSAHADGTFCLIDLTPEGDETFKGPRGELKEFLSPFPYNLNTLSFAQAFAASKQQNNLIYEVASRHFRTTQDHYGERVDALLLAAASLTKGHADPLQAVDISPLYASDNHSYGTEIRHSVFERLCAAWYYLADREEPFAVSPIGLLDRSRATAFRRLRDLSADLKAGLALRTQPRDERLRQRIAETEKQAKQSGAWSFVDLLDKWLDLRRDPPWQVKLEEIEPEDRPDFIHDWEDQLEQLTALETILAELSSPVCELPLQGVRLDKRRVELVLQKFRRDQT